MVILDEAFWPGHKEFTGTLKSLVTNTQLMIERKGVDPIAEPNLTQLFVLTNADWVWPYELSDRRALVLDVRDNKVGDRDYWDAYYAEVTSQEGLSALLAYLQQREIKSDLRRVPRTEAAGKQFQLSASSLDRLVYTWLERGYIDPDSDEWPEWVTVEDLYAIYRYELHGDRHLKHYTHQAFTAEIQRLLPLGAKTRRRVVDWSVKQELVRRNGCLPAPEQMKFRQRRRYGHALPPLATCRAHLERITGITHSWPDAIQLPLEQAS